MNTSEAIRSRRSVRKYVQGAQIPQEHYEMILEAAMMAPSACNRRPWVGCYFVNNIQHLLLFLHI